VKVEDVLGRVFPFPSKFSIEALSAEIVSRFKEGPGKTEVSAGHFEILNAKTSTNVLDMAGDSFLLPGMSVNMAIILERKSERGYKCPVPNCKSPNIYDTLGWKTW